MSQHDYNIANGGGAAVRADINNALLAILSQNSGATAPTTTKPFMFWYDTTTGVLKMRNAADTAWVDAITGVSGGNGLGMVNRIINGRMEIDQRNLGASLAISNAAEKYCLDRYAIFAATGSGHTVQQVSDAPAGFNNSLKVTIGTGGSPSSTHGNYFYQAIEGYNVADFGWGAAGAAAVTLSFWVKSSLTGQFSGAIANNGVGRSYPFTFTINSANTWEQKVINISGDTSGTWNKTNSVGCYVWMDLGGGSNQQGTAGAWVGADKRCASGSVQLVATSGATLQVVGFDLRKGTFTSAPAWDWRPYGTELALCQRYLPAINTTSTYELLGWGSAISAGQALVNFPLPVTPRVPPTGISTNAMSNFVFRNGSNSSSTPTSIQIGSQSSANMYQMVINGISATTGQAVFLLSVGSGAQILLTGCEL
jgi:hypothetical protein